jgi:23S rRNA pseudouridine1911/1915/1917 synthase
MIRIPMFATKHRNAWRLKTESRKLMPNSMYSFTIEPADARLRVDEFLALRFGLLSRIRIARLVAEGACRLNSEPAVAGQRVKIGDVVEFEVGDPGPSAMTPEAIPLQIVFEDDHVIVVDKPSGMLVHPTIGVKAGTMANAVTYHLNKSALGRHATVVGEVEGDPARGITARLVRPGIVHRLDRATSGLMVIAKTQQALSVLSRHFRKRLIEKRYVALVLGDVSADSGSIQAPIGRDPDRRPHWWVTENGKPAETRYRVLERFTAATLMELEPVTGRTNQLRIHCAYAGHSIVGDEYYGGNAVTPSAGNSPIEGGAGGPLQSSPGRLFLHAARLVFKHPRTGELMVFVSNLPGELEVFLRSLKPTRHG